MRDLIIIGAGPAGLSAAVYAKRACMDVLVYEKTGLCGGQIITTESVDNYLGLNGVGGFELGNKFYEHASQQGVMVEDGTVETIVDHGTHKEVKLEDGRVLESRAVLVATGAFHKKLNIPGEETYMGAGVSYCATCDGAFYRGKEVACVGGGNVALAEAIYLSKLCKKVYLIHRRDTFRAAKNLQEQVFNQDNIEILYDTQVQEICGSGTVETLKLLCKEEQKEICVNGIFVAIGMEPGTGFVRDLVACDEQGYILAGEDGCTSVEGIYVAGDCRTKHLRQVTTAVSDGANAIASVERYLIKLEQSKHVHTDADLQINRYQRQLMLPEIGEQGQEKLKQARVLIVGAGGLGSPVAMYLTAAGVGHLGIMDADKVAVHNLQRQILHDESRVHMNKARSAQKTLQVMNHETTIQVYEEFLTPENAQLLASYDFVIDAVDNYKTKFLINDICVRMGKPFCHAGVSGFSGQAMTWIPNTECACYRCIFGEEPEDIEKPSSFGIIGPIPGILGSIQALEAIKYITGCGQLLTNRMFVFDGLSMKSRLVKLKKREGCKA